jgi:hypothetical protein
MKDTSPKMTEKMKELMLNKSPEERLRLGCSMFDFSKELVTNAILRERSSISAPVLRQELFLKFYGSELDTRQREKILKHLSKLT